MLLHLFRFLSRFPLPVLHALGAALGWLVYLVSPTYRRRLRDNITRAGHAAHLRAAIAESGKSVLELPFVWCAPPEKVLAKASVDDWQAAQAILDQGRGAIFLTPHLGCFEILAQSIAQHVQLTALYRPPRKAVLRPLIEGARARANLLLAPANLAGVRMMLKAIKHGNPVGLLPDQVPQQGEGAWVDFFGKPAYTMTLPGKLQQMTGAPLILSYADRLPGGRGYRLHFVPFADPLGDTAEEQARAINAAMEKLIARNPAQYFWSYNRYKTPAGVSAPTGAGEQA
ncbi:MAG: lysophospholipid acyltransferase family protein [Proteobacteria bacterium]|nr:lysophospholipid acyltransferase family protein [Pseudomonadota bacterium]